MKYKSHDYQSTIITNPSKNWNHSDDNIAKISRDTDESDRV